MSVYALEYKGRLSGIGRQQSSTKNIRAGDLLPWLFGMEGIWMVWGDNSHSRHTNSPLRYRE